MNMNYLGSIRAIRADVGTRLLQDSVCEALGQVMLPEGWIIQRNPSSILYCRKQRRLPHVKVYFDKYRVDVDVGSGYSVKSTRQEFETADEMGKYVQSQIWSFTQ